jgi:KUP system potassium uptake protein
MNALPLATPGTSHSAKATAPLMIAAIGVVYGDIGTSPLYALKESFSPEHGLALSQANVLGILSLLFWTMTLVVSIKYVAFVLRADNSGEGGILALTALVLRKAPKGSRTRSALVMLGLAGASMFYGDAVITPAISVLSAIEGIEIATPLLHHYIVPITIGVIAGLFVIQSYGTASVGRWFGPIMVLWFLLLAAMGLAHIAANPGVLLALSPTYAIAMFVAHPLLAFGLLGAVFLSVTGAEALYADMGHFGRGPVRVDWFALVMPSLVLNYFGQGALVLADAEAVKNPFYLMVPQEFVLPLVVVATAATVIASQAVISGAYSLTQQAIQLGYAPRMQVEHTSSRQMGQIYMPFVNWALFVSVVMLVLAFHNSSALASAYGIAVSGTMVITTILLIFVARHIWNWGRIRILLLLVPLLAFDAAFFLANATKFTDGGYVPLAIGGVCFFLFVTWKRGRQILFTRLTEHGVALQTMVESLVAHPPQRVPGTAVFMTGTLATCPHALLHNLKHNKVLHERVVFLTIVTHDVPAVPEVDRVQLKKLAEGFYAMEAWYGFKQEPDMEEILGPACERYGLAFDPMDTSFFLSRETVIPSELPGMAKWRDKVFAWMSRNGARATDYFNIPANRVVELGTHVEI